MRCACTWASSPAGVSQTISTGTPCFCVSSFAAASAPVRAERKTGLFDALGDDRDLEPGFGGAAGAVPDPPQAAAAAMIACRPPDLEPASHATSCEPRMSRRAVNRALAWSSTTATITAPPMMIHS